MLMRTLVFRSMQPTAPSSRPSLPSLPSPLPPQPSFSTSAHCLSHQRSPDSNKGPVNHVGSEPTPKQVAMEISRQFKNCLPHTHGESELHRTAFEGDAVKIRDLLAQIDLDPYKHETINQRNRLGCTPLRLAATGGHLECLTHLINAGASIDTSDVKCQTPLFVAVKNRRLDCAEKLLKSGAHPDGDPGNSSTPLYVAFMNRDVRYVLLLLEYGAHPDKLHHKTRVSQNMYNLKFTSLDAAIEYLVVDKEVYQAVKALLIGGCKTEDFHYHTCVYHNREQLVNLLYNFGVKTGGRDLSNRLATELNMRNSAERTLISLRGVSLYASEVISSQLEVGVLVLSPCNCELVFFAADAVEVLRHSIISARE